MSDSLIPSFLMSDVRSLNKIEQCEQIAQVAHHKWETMSELLVFLANRLFAHFFAKNERFTQKNKRFPALEKANVVINHWLSCEGLEQFK